MSNGSGLHDFGYRFLGPVVTAFFDRIVTVGGSEKLYFLAREGYFLKQLFERYCSVTGSSLSGQAEYLYCSRAFLFKLSLLEADLVDDTLVHHYKGTFLNFLIRRYGLNGGDIDRILCKTPAMSAEFDKEIRLPSETVMVGKLLSGVVDALRPELECKRDLYLSYLQGIDFLDGSEQRAVIDIGFSGTIQKLLSRMTGKRTVGHYMVTTQKAIDTELCSFYGHFATGQAFSEGFTLLDRSLYLEALLTAPHGQVVDIFNINGVTRFGYASKTLAQHHFGLLEAVVRGAEQYMEDTVPDGAQLTAEDIPGYYNSLVSSLSGFPAELRSIIEVDDHISGFGVINPAQLFG